MFSTCHAFIRVLHRARKRGAVPRNSLLPPRIAQAGPNYISGCGLVKYTRRRDGEDHQLFYATNEPRG